MLSPSSRFSNTTAAGVRVPLNTHAPLTLPGTLSTAGHWDQSSAAITISCSIQLTRSSCDDRNLAGSHVLSFNSEGRESLGLGTIEHRASGTVIFGAR